MEWPEDAGSIHDFSFPPGPDGPAKRPRLDPRYPAAQANGYTSKPSRTPLTGRGRSHPSYSHLDPPMAVGVEQLQVVGRVRTASAAPDSMVDPALLLRDSRGLTWQS